MNKYLVYLADNYSKSEPFLCDWDYELLGDKLRAEFDVWFSEQEALANAGVGKSRRLLKGELVKKFMVIKRIKLIDDPATQSLKSVFILRHEEKKLIDERAKESLAPRFEYRVKTFSDGSKGEPLGFLKFKLVEGEEKKDKLDTSFKVSGNDIEYFSDTSEESKAETEDVKDEEKFTCETCGKSFSDKRKLNAHNLHHKKK
jgi:hypothetical protein